MMRSYKLKITRQKEYDGYSYFILELTDSFMENNEMIK